MTTPIEFKNAFIETLTKLGGWTFNQEQERFLYDRLCRKSAAELEKAAYSIAEKSKKKPTLAELIDSFPPAPIGIANVQVKEDEPYKPYPAKFIREIVQPFMQEYAMGVDMEQWKSAFKGATETWERDNFQLSTHRPTTEDYRYSEAYFASVMKAMAGGLARGAYSQQNRKNYGGLK